ncbi:WYL domain-containing protein [Sulfurimonas sp.]|uniref:WYL domain-containing protein n=1 Tax=Sulfurimonas sp. TaxID=2022749 RepID=UPI002AB06183|nr:WYL domain-containing protein [Sulfurimonas sp.]
MNKKYRAEEVLPYIIRKISNGEAISTKDIVKRFNLKKSTLTDHIKEVREQFYENDFKYDDSTYKWIRTEPEFLKKSLLSPEEAVVLTGILRNKSKFGDKLVSSVEKVVHNYVKRTKTSIFKQDILERIDENFEIIFAQLKYAIEKKKKIKFTFYGTHRIFYPYKIINLEYYWYLLGYEEYSEYNNRETKKIKTYTIDKIRDLEILKESFKYDFTETEDELKNAMNAFFSVGEKTKTIEVLVVKWLVEYIKRAPYFSGWHNTNIMETIDSIQYAVFEIKSSNKYYKDIIPTILKYIPNIRIRDDIDVVEKIFQDIDTYASFHSKTLNDTSNTTDNRSNILSYINTHVKYK